MNNIKLLDYKKKQLNEREKVPFVRETNVPSFQNKNRLGETIYET